jgi:hypothetical protein
MDKVKKSRISGKEASYVALAAAQYPPVKIGAPDNSEQSSEATQTTPNLPAPVDGSGIAIVSEGHHPGSVSRRRSTTRFWHLQRT